MPHIDPLPQLEEWVKQYKDDEEPQRIGQKAAIEAMEYLLTIFRRHGLCPASLKGAQAEVRRMLEILNAFHGKLAILEYMNGIRPEGDDDD